MRLSLVVAALLLSACARPTEFGSCEAGVASIATEANAVLCM